MDQLSGTHAHHDICCGSVGTKIPTILRFDSFGDESLLGLKGQIHYIGKVQVKLVSLNLNRDPEIFRNTRGFQIAIATCDLDIALTVATPYRLSVPSHIDDVVRDLNTPNNPTVLDNIKVA
jgi:hypothetical protein